MISGLGVGTHKIALLVNGTGGTPATVSLTVEIRRTGNYTYTYTCMYALPSSHSLLCASKSMTFVQQTRSYHSQ